MRALRVLERAERTTDTAERRELGKLAESYMKLAEEAEGRKKPATQYPGGGGMDDQHAS